jgi:hypothetical protein
MPANKSPLRVLSDIVSNAVTKVDEQYATANLEFPFEPGGKFRSRQHSTFELRRYPERFSRCGSC